MAGTDLLKNLGFSGQEAAFSGEKPLWDDLPEATRLKMADAGMTPDSYFMADQASLSPFMEGTSTGGFGDLGIMDQAKVGLGVGQLGLGIAGYLDNKKTADLQRENLGTQIASNKDLLATRKKRATDISSAFGKKPIGLGA